MIANTIKKTMLGAITRFAQKEQVEMSEIALFIHTKQEDCAPQYFYTVKGKVKRDEQENMINLDFKSDILNTKLDFLGKEALADNFLKSFLKNASEEHQMHHHNIYVQISGIGKEVYLALFELGEKKKDLKLSEVFGD